MPDDADELCVMDSDVDVFDRDERPRVRRKDFRKSGQLERYDDAHRAAFSTATDENDGGGSCRVRSGRARDASR